MAWAPAMGVITKVSHTLLIVKICRYLSVSAQHVLTHENLSLPVSMLCCLENQSVGSVVHVHAIGHEIQVWPL